MGKAGFRQAFIHFKRLQINIARMLSSVTLYCQVTMPAMLQGSQLSEM